MYIKTNNLRYPCTGYATAADTVRFYGAAGMTGAATGTVELFSDGDFLIASVRAEDYKRQSFEGEVLMLTNEPLPPPAPEPTIETRRADKLSSLSGKCSGAIYAGRDISAKHYNFGAQAQDNIKGMLIEIQNGKTAFLYGADGEALSTHTAAQISEIGQVMGEWINVNTAYYEQLKIWVGRETDVPTLTALHYGSALPADLMKAMAAKLAEVGIDAGKYAGAFG